DHFQRRLRADAYLLGFHGLGHFAYEVDHQQAVRQVGLIHAHEVRELEATFEAAVGDADMEHVAVRSLLALAALDRQQVLLRGDLEIVRAEAGYRQRDAIAVLAAALDVERGVVVARIARLALEQIEQAIEANG